MKKTIFFLSISLLFVSTATFASTKFFSDVPEDTWYTEAVQNLSEKGIVQGYSDGTFGPEKNVTRAEIAVMLDRLMNYNEIPVVSDEYNWNLEHGDPENLCFSPTYEGYATIRGWYVYEDTVHISGWVLNILPEDKSKLPLENLMQKSRHFNEKLVIVDAKKELEEALINATKDHPVAISIRGYTAYCESYPRVALFGSDLFDLTYSELQNLKK